MESPEKVKPEEEEEKDSLFVWDETTQLYFHSRSGFYHDPSAGWYYNSRDGVYYKFENGSYMLLESNKVNELESHRCSGTVPDDPVQNESTTQVYCNTEDNVPSLPANQLDACQCYETVPDQSTGGYTEDKTDQAAENPPPPSEWLEETLINLYLSGYNQAVNSYDVSTMSLKVNDGDSFNFSADGASHVDSQTLEDGEWISERHGSLTDQCKSIIDEDALKDEENWQAQYGQVVRAGEQPMQDFRFVDLWDWAMVTGSRNDRKSQTARLVGRLVKCSTKLHPSISSCGGLFRTAPICEADLDLVRVRTGQVYKLHSPNARYLASLSSYDSSNPTKDWGFPELSINIQDISVAPSSGKSEQKLTGEDVDCKGMFMSPNQLSISKKPSIHEYRDRAAERRILHGGFGVGPGQKNSLVDGATSPVSTSTEEAAAEALNISFGAGSYARKILANMGWKEGEALGKTRKGLTKPIQPIGNVGNAGLGWPQGRMAQ